MAEFTNLKLTKYGEEYLGRTLVEPIDFTTAIIKLSTQVVNPLDILTLTRLNTVSDISIITKAQLNQSTNTLVISTRFHNLNINSDITINTIGLFVSNNGTENLIAATTATEPLIVRKYNKTTKFYNLKLSLNISSDSNTPITITDGNFASFDDINRLETDKQNKLKPGRNIHIHNDGTIETVFPEITEIAQLRGPKGDTGPQGPPGIQGKKGDPGVGIPQTISKSKDTIVLSDMGGSISLTDYAKASQVLTDVPSDAKFTDTIYTHPTSHPASMITETSTKRFVTDDEKSTWNSKQDALIAGNNIIISGNTISASLEGIETGTTTNTIVSAHIENKSNPHNITKEQIGLGNVLNFGMATELQAQEGIAANVYMSPLRTYEAIDKQVPKRIKPQFWLGKIEQTIRFNIEQAVLINHLISMTNNNLSIINNVISNTNLSYDLDIIGISDLTAFKASLAQNISNRYIALNSDHSNSLRMKIDNYIKEIS